MSQAPVVLFPGQCRKGSTVLGVKVVEGAGNIERKAPPFLASLVLLQVVHQGNEFWLTPKEQELLANVRERFVYQDEILIVLNHRDTSGQRMAIVITFCGRLSALANIHGSV